MFSGIVSTVGMPVGMPDTGSPFQVSGSRSCENYPCGRAACVAEDETGRKRKFTIVLDYGNGARK